MSLGLPRAVLRVLGPLKCTWIAFLLHSFLNFSLVWVYRDCCAAVVGVGSGGVGLLVGVGESVLPLVEDQRGKLAVFECCFDMFKFLIHVVLG